VRSGIALSTRGGGAGRDEEAIGGIPFKEDPNVLRPRSGGPAGGAARESEHGPKKGTLRLGGNAAKNAHTPSEETPDATVAG